MQHFTLYIAIDKAVSTYKKKTRTPLPVSTASVRNLKSYLRWRFFLMLTMQKRNKKDIFAFLEKPPLEHLVLYLEYLKVVFAKLYLSTKRKLHNHLNNIFEGHSKM